MSDSKITYREYWKEVDDLPKGIIKELREEGLRGEDLRERAFDRLHEDVDGHQWIIYTWAYPYVLIHSKNEDALYEQQGEQQATSYSQIMQMMAFYAFYQDCSEELESQLGDVDDDEDE